MKCRGGLRAKRRGRIWIMCMKMKHVNWRDHEWINRHR